MTNSSTSTDANNAGASTGPRTNTGTAEPSGATTNNETNRRGQHGRGGRNHNRRRSDDAPTIEKFKGKIDTLATLGTKGDKKTIHS